MDDPHPRQLGSSIGHDMIGSIPVGNETEKLLLY